MVRWYRQADRDVKVVFWLTIFSIACQFFLATWDLVEALSG